MTTANISLNAGNIVTWESNAGTLTGEITSVEMGLNAAKKMIPWVTIVYGVLGRKNKCTVRLAATESNLIMMRVRRVM